MEAAVSYGALSDPPASFGINAGKTCRRSFFEGRGVDEHSGLSNGSASTAGAHPCAGLALTVAALVVLAVGFTIGHFALPRNGCASLTPASSAVAPPAPFPQSMLWRLLLIEHHNLVGRGSSDVTFGNYYFDWGAPSGLVASRQENGVSYAGWRYAIDGDLPWNVFFANEGKVYAAHVDLARGTLACQNLGLQYTASFWPRNFLTANCKLKNSGVIESIPFRFNSSETTAVHLSFDGRPGVALACLLWGGAVTTIQPTIWLDPSTGLVLRFDIEKASPGWNPQTWDVLQQQDLGLSFNRTFLAIPSLCGK